MEHAKKMVLVDPRMLQSPAVNTVHITQPETTAIDITLRGLDGGLQRIMENANLPMDQKAKLYTNHLQQYLTMKDKQTNAYTPPLPPPPPPTPTQFASTSATAPPSAAVEEEVMQSIPSKLQKQGRMLMDRVKRDPDMSWNERGELIAGGKVVPNSNMTDLVNDILRNRKSVVPLGWEVFSGLLRKGNVPQDLVRNPERLKFTRREPWVYDSTVGEEEGGASRTLTPSSVQDAVLALSSGRKSRTLRRRRRSPSPYVVPGTKSRPRVRAPPRLGEWIDYN